MSVWIAGHEFGHASYDDVGDVLYLRNVEPSGASLTTYATPEGHALRLDAAGSIVGITIVNARWLVDRESKLVVSAPQQRIEVDAVEVGALLERTMST